nr:MAG TPA: hypothetical protein [Caudoviricetes sp.]
MSTQLHVMPGFCLVEVTNKYGSSLSISQGDHGSHTSGTLKAVYIHENGTATEKEATLSKFLGSKIYFTKYNDSEEIELDDKTFIFVPVDAVNGGSLDA